MKQYVTLFMLLVFACLPLLLVSCTETEYQKETGPAPATECLRVLSHQRQTGEYGNLYIVGKARNVSGKTLSYAEIRVKFKDASGALIDTFFDNVNDLGSGETWRFSVIYLGLSQKSFATYEIGVGTCW